MVPAEQFIVGAKVVSADSRELGVVGEIAGDSFKVARRFRPDLYVDHVSSGIVQMTGDGLDAAKLS